ncbi:MAG: cell division protein ZapA [Candidatus Sedimenticola endophacoides]|uniref:Cell division protein ZapA n=1 Tax=Candidatus Sedimenticola endophacoides TaxID=2548426 RepID=A0A657PSM5_9GAMM|nr:MAG: cell division protein ZapA [Candidatus Sedimenticola endophacoides]OQX32859.1 MAG: cell division protein ZapA [Candidatus Sedimenticola endophacoides]OQX33715.1 MAG: cell division protein ZapA [Candidatus Sedimenticola endophacoides]OQX40293.1 MAG: cell division protein ZapA [Candidatus Sedimenticola endophacoides]OQX42231.1 MAG: cell division protein ZapA [Candidatus Sedimenticola endophacoides]
MSNETIPVTVRIMEKEYRVACRQDEQESLLASARFLDQKMREIRTSGKVIGTDRIAVMAALNLAHDLLDQKNSKDSSTHILTRRLRAMQEKIDLALNQSNQLDL